MGALRSRAGQELLALLALRGGQVLDREWLAETLWPDSRPDQSRYNLRRNLTDLRDALGEEATRLSSPTIRGIRLETSGAWIDVTEFDCLVSRSDPPALHRAVEIYRGELLAGLGADWVTPERELRAQAYVAALERLAADEAAQGDTSAATGYLRRVMAVDPLRETALRTLMELLAERSEHAALAQVYRDFRLYLYRELNAAPDPATAALYERLKHRQSVPALTRLSAAVSGRLPHPLTGLVGRELAVKDIVASISSARLVTLCGTGGIGKTRLAIAAAQTAATAYTHGAWFVDLSGLADAALIVPVIARTLGVAEQPNRSPLESLKEFLSTRRLLIVLDNCEHLLQDCANVVSDLLGCGQEVRILATSREPLRVTGEVTWRVPGLPCPFVAIGQKRRPPRTAQDKDWLAVIQEYPAVSLFVELARRVQPDWRLTGANAEVVADICRQLDGIPLAIELAAARIRALSVEAIHAGLSDRFRLLRGGSRSAMPRHQSLEALIDWSYDQLTAEEQRLLRRLCVFSGGADLQAVREVTEVPETEDVLTSLVDRSLVVYDLHGGAPRYRLLDTIRQYARAKLIADPTEAEGIPRNHAAYFLSVGERAAAEIMGPKQQEWLNRLEEEHDNLRTALSWAEQDGTEAEWGLWLASSLYRFWWLRGHVREGRDRLGRALSRSGTQAPPAVRIAALCGLGGLAQCQGDFEDAATHCQMALALARESGCADGEAEALLWLGDVVSNQGRYEEARKSLQQAVELFRKLGNSRGEAEALGRLGYVAREQGQVALGRELMEEALKLHRKRGDAMNEAWNLGCLGYTYLEEADEEKARSSFLRTLAIYRDYSNLAGQAWSLNSLGLVAIRERNYANARSALEEARDLYVELGDQAGIAWNLELLGRVLGEQKEYASARQALETALQISRRIGSRKSEATCLRDLGRVAAGQDDLTSAHKLYSEAVSVFQELGMKREVADVTRLLSALGMGRTHP